MALRRLVEAASIYFIKLLPIKFSIKKDLDIALSSAAKKSTSLYP